jgi:hypothetical protein
MGAICMFRACSEAPFGNDFYVPPIPRESGAQALRYSAASAGRFERRKGEERWDSSRSTSN